MIRWFRDKVQAFKAQRELARQTDPRNFKQMAMEIRDLALLASQLNPREKDIHKLIRNIVVEMERLAELADRPEFRKLSTGKKLLLRQGLKESRDQLLESIESAQAPNQAIQRPSPHTNCFYPDSSPGPVTTLAGKAGTGATNSR